MASTLIRVSAITVKAVVVVIAGACFTAAAKAEVRDIAFTELAMESDLIVVAKVSKVEDAPTDLKAAAEDEGVATLKVATAEVIETWKGEPVREVRYFASSTWMCDLTGAEKGERVVLFLEKRNFMRRNEPRLMSIAHAGRGRWTLRDVGGKACASISPEVILPEGTSTISDKTTARLVTRGSDPDKDAKPLEFTCTGKYIELATLRELVRASTHNHTPKGG